MRSILAIFMFITFGANGSSDKQVLIQNGSKLTRSVASTENVKRLLEIDERRGCCSHHGGVSHCSNGVLYCNDGWVSGCGC